VYAYVREDESVLQCVAVCCSVLKCVADYCSVLQCVAVCYGWYKCVVVCCNVLQCVEGCCRVYDWYLMITWCVHGTHHNGVHMELIGVHMVSWGGYG